MVDSAPPLVLGIDPGSRVAGFAFIQSRKAVPYHAKDFRVVDAGVIKVQASLSHAERIGHLHESLFQLIKERRPQFAVMEKAFLGINANSSLKLGEARGAFLSALARGGIFCDEITPAQVKAVIAGNGQAGKDEISTVVEATLGFSRGQLPHDVTDAVAVALSYTLRKNNLVRG